MQKTPPADLLGIRDFWQKKMQTPRSSFSHWGVLPKVKNKKPLLIAMIAIKLLSQAIFTSLRPNSWGQGMVP